MGKTIIPICFAFDNNLILPACICLTSLLMNAHEDTFYDIFILYSRDVELNTQELDRLPDHYKNCSISYRPINNVFKSAYQTRGITTPAYFRLLIPEIISEYDKVLYSDVDVIFREDLSKFYNVDIDDFYFGAVDVGVEARKDIKEYVEQEIKLDASNGFFYSGNLIMNLKLLRKDKMLDKFMLLSKNDYRFQDMDIINIACNGKIKSISPEFCLTNYLYELLLNRPNEYSAVDIRSDVDNIMRKGVVHYNGIKPWAAWCINHDIWWYYYRKSLFYDEKFCYNFYSINLNESEQWTLWKRIKHVIRFFKNRNVKKW